MRVTSRAPMKKLRKFIYFGTPYVAKDTLALLYEAGYIPALVVTSPDAPKGRGMTLTPTETNVLASQLGIPVITPEKLTSEVIAELKVYGTDYALVVAYGKLFPQELIDVFPLGVLNIHYSLLPKYRGASPVESALFHGETRTGVSIQKMVLKMDAGDILAQKETAIDPTETTRELRPRLVRLGAELLLEVLPAFEEEMTSFTPQNEAEAARSGKIRKEDGELTLTGDARTNWNKYRAYAESPGTYFFMQKVGKAIRVKIKTASFDGTHFSPLRVVPEGKSETDYASLV
ncbi:MAG: methionyl-tRNA formyltransferase [Patescibacteria group bacterium]